MQIKTSTLIVGANARTINQSTGHDTSSKPTGQGYGAARKGPGVKRTYRSSSKRRTYKVYITKIMPKKRKKKKKIKGRHERHDIGKGDKTDPTQVQDQLQRCS